MSDAAGNSAFTTRSVTVNDYSEFVGDTLNLNDRFGANQGIQSPNGEYKLKLQDGNLVLSNSSNEIFWSVATSTGSVLALQLGDGNLVLRDASVSPVWSSHTGGMGVTKLVIHNNGSLVLYAGDTPVWIQNEDRIAPVITLNDASSVTLDYAATYVEAGAAAFDNADGDITASIQISGSVGSAPGDYSVTYSVSDAAGNSAFTTRNVTVNADAIAPVITLNGASSVILEYGSAYIEAGATASDNADGDISANIQVSGSVGSTSGYYTVTYTVLDAAGNSSSATCNVTVNADAIAPVITLNGASSVILEYGSAYIEAGATASDNADGDISASIQISGSVGSAPGDYSVTYSVSDAAGNSAFTTRSVTVNDYSEFVGDTLNLNDRFGANQGIQSPNGEYKLKLQDGNLVLSNSSNEIFWSVATSTGSVLALQLGDGNLVLRDASVSPVWSSHTGGMGVTKLVIHNNGSLVLYAGDTPVWSQNTLETPPVDPETSGLIKLPIEVLGEQGYQRSVTIDMSDPSQITHLYLRCYSCGFDDKDLDGNAGLVKATVTINDENPIALKQYTYKGKVVGNQDIKIIGPEQHYGGIGGAFRTVRFSVPIAGMLKQGNNTLTFTHKTLRAPSIGFRIIDLNFILNSQINTTKIDPASLLLAAQDFEYDEPINWKAPSAVTSVGEDIIQGEIKWRARNSLTDIGLDALNGDSRDGSMIASCADCHAEDGRDLAYFNFSNHSIIERSYFHGLSRNDGKQIAAYIRNLGIPVVPQARPWNPPYQPGPDLDVKGAYEWAAGAGLDAILDNDNDMEPYLFPNGTSMTAVRNVTDRFGTLNMRELPISIPMPDWNQWLPLVHPDDAFNTSANAINQDSSGNSVGQPYYKFLYQKAINNPTPSNLGNMASKLKKWVGRGADCYSQGNSGEPLRALNGNVLTSLRLSQQKIRDINNNNCNSENVKVFSRDDIEPVEAAKRGLGAWVSVKHWELNHTNDLETQAIVQGVGGNVCSGDEGVNVCVDARERGWVMDGRNVFDRPSHFTGHNARNFVNQDKVVGYWETNAWYHLQMILNPGYRKSMPSHFAYTLVWNDDSVAKAGTVSQAFRYFAAYIKMRQQQTNGKYGLESGMDMRTAQPFWVYSDEFGSTRNRVGLGQPLWSNLAGALIEDMVGDARNTNSTVWNKTNQNRKVQRSNSTDISACDSCFNNTSRPHPFQTPGLYQGRNNFRAIPKLREIGVSEEVLNGLIDWSDDTWIWSGANWDGLKVND